MKFENTYHIPKLEKRRMEKTNDSNTLKVRIMNVLLLDRCKFMLQ